MSVSALTCCRVVLLYSGFFCGMLIFIFFVANLQVTKFLSPKVYVSWVSKCIFSFTCCIPPVGNPQGPLSQAVLCLTIKTSEAEKKMQAKSKASIYHGWKVQVARYRSMVTIVVTWSFFPYTSLLKSAYRCGSLPCTNGHWNIKQTSLEFAICNRSTCIRDLEFRTINLKTNSELFMKIYENNPL